MKHILTGIALLLLFTGCSDSSQPGPSSGVPGTPAAVQQGGGLHSLSPVQVKALLESRPGIVILDVRTPQERQAYGAIQGGQLVPFWAIMQNKLNLSHDVPILVYCAVGGRSYFAGQMLLRHGYREIYNLEGGLDAWRRAGLPLG